MTGAFLCWWALCAAPQDTIVTWQVQAVTESALPETLGTRLHGYQLLELANAKPVPPYLDIRVAIRLPDGTVWAGSDRGLMWYRPGQPHWRLFHSRRWLPDDHVTDLAVRDPHEIYVQTAEGVVRLARQRSSVGAKIEQIQQDLRAHHVRFGLVGSVVVNEPGSLAAGWVQPDSDNDGLWTSLYVAAESFRFAATGAADARDNAWQSLQGMMFLEQITGSIGFPARSVVPIAIDKQGQWPWEKSADGKWWWKGDTSSDEMDGHFFAYSVYYDLAATESQKQQIRPVVQRIMDRIVEGGWYLRDPTGRITTWGRWAPELLNRDPEWIAERGLNSLEILSYLKTAHHITGDERFAREARQLIDQHGYAINTIRQKLTDRVDVEVNHSDDELAFVAYYPLLRYEQDPQLRAIYLLSLERSWQVERPEESPLFNFIYAAGRQASAWPQVDQRPAEPLLAPSDYDQSACRRWFTEVPADLFSWTVVNSDRCDLGQRYLSRHRQACSSRLLPVSERPLMRWNGNPYALDGGNGGRERDDGTYILLPYWMGRYHRFLD